MVGPVPLVDRVQRVRVGDVLLDEVVLVLRHRDVEAGARDDAALVERVLVGVAQRHELVVLLEVGEGERRRERHRLEREVESALEPLLDRPQLLARRHAVEAADPHVDRVDLAAAHERHEVVADLLQLERLLHGVAVVLRHVDGALVAEEVGRVEHVHVERVRLDPLAAVEEPPQGAQRTGHADAARRLHRVDRAHLVRDGADPADPRRDVGHLGERAPPQERLEEAGGLVDAQLHVGDAAALQLDGEAALALDARERVDDDRLRGLAGGGATGDRAHRRRSRSGRAGSRR